MVKEIAKIKDKFGVTESTRNMNINLYLELIYTLYG